MTQAQQVSLASMNTDSSAGTLLVMQTDFQLKAALAARLNSHAETSGHSSCSNGGSQQEGPSAEERRTSQKRAREECNEAPAPIRVDVSDSGATQAFYSASRNNYEVGHAPSSCSGSSVGQRLISTISCLLCSPLCRGLCQEALLFTCSQQVDGTFQRSHHFQPKVVLSRLLSWFHICRSA